jgi:hypothetical protein
MKPCSTLLVLAAVFSGLLCVPAHSASFSFPGSETWSTDQKDALAAAGALWSKFITDPITVTIAVSFGETQGLASASTTLYGYPFDTIRNAMVADAANEADDAIVASLPTFANFNATKPDGVTV